MENNNGLEHYKRMKELKFFPRLFLLSADYEDNSGLSLQERTRIIRDECRQEAHKYHESLGQKMIKPFVDYCIVLWRDLPKTNIPDNTEDTLFNTFCKNIFLYSEYGLGLIYIKDKNTLANQSFERFVKRLCLLGVTKPVFFDDTVDNLLTSRLKSYDDNDILDFVSKHMEENKEYTRIIMFLKKLYTSISGDTLDNEEKGFIYYYFEWQRGNISSDTACKELGNMSRRTFYRYIAEFEQHPYFAEYCKLFPDLLDKPKKGPLSVDLEEFYNEVLPFFSGEVNALIIENMNIDNICKKYSLASSIDVYRTFLAVKKKLKIK